MEQKVPQLDAVCGTAICPWQKAFGLNAFEISDI
jgi:hypothetical protein